MKDKTPIINIFTYGLPYKLTNQIYNEFQQRWKEANYIINEVQRYSDLKQHMHTVELLLAMSIFHKRVVSNLDGAIKFYGTVNKKSQADTISLGSYDLTAKEKNKILGLLINYKNLIRKYGISESLMDYYKTKDFLLNLKKLKSNFEDIDDETKNNREKDNSSEGDIPF